LKILITGARGLVGRALTEHTIQRGDEVFPHDRSALNITDIDQVERLIVHSNPDVVINCAAWTDVDGCESDVTRSDAVNALGPENLAKVSRKVGALFITISTDYVFDGTKDGFYTQRDDPNPLSVYARSKLQGERRSQLQYARTIVVRTGFVFGQGGKNFLSTVVDRLQRGEKPKAISDAWGTPTYAIDLAVRLRELAELDLPGVFHVGNSGDGTSYELFAKEASRLAGYDKSSIEAVSIDSVIRPAPRPRNSRLRCLLSEAVGLMPLPTWQQGLERFVTSEIQKHTEKSQVGG
jgi:dTDP-4-dehydrorhamnose reductase